MKSLFTLCILIFILSSAIPVQARIIHVPNDSSTIQGGINGAVNGDTVLVAEGDHHERINFGGKEILVTSEFMNDGDLSHIQSTIIDGDESGRVVSFTSGEIWKSIIQGFTIQNGEASRGGGVACSLSSPTIVHCVIENNTAQGGGGIFCHQSSPTIDSCEIVSNAVYVITPGDHKVTSIIRGSAPPGKGCGGGILCVESSNLSISNCTIADNSAFVSFVGGTGGGISCLQSSAIITSCAIYHNWANTWAGGILCGSSSLFVSNCTFAYNFASEGGGILSVECDPYSEVKNSIFWANDPDQICLYSAPILWVNYCDVQGGWPLGVGNLNCCPMFCDPNADNYYLAENSCCVGAGEGGVDIGAFGVGCLGYVRGDVNQDGIINIGDVVYLINYLYREGPAPDPLPAGDNNCDDVVDIGDVVYLINYLYKGGPPP